MEWEWPKQFEEVIGLKGVKWVELKHLDSAHFLRFCRFIGKADFEMRVKKGESIDTVVSTLFDMGSTE